MGGWRRTPLTICALVCLCRTCPAAWLQGQGVACQEARAQGSKVIFQTGVSTRWLRTQLHRTEQSLQVDDAFDPSPKCPKTLLFLVCAQKLLNISITDKYSLVILWLAFFKNRAPLRNCSNYCKFQFGRIIFLIHAEESTYVILLYEMSNLMLFNIKNVNIKAMMSVSSLGLTRTSF